MKPEGDLAIVSKDTLTGEFCVRDLADEMLLRSVSLILSAGMVQSIFWVNQRRNFWMSYRSRITVDVDLLFMEMRSDFAIFGF